MPENMDQVLGDISGGIGFNDFRAKYGEEAHNLIEELEEEGLIEGSSTFELTQEGRSLLENGSNGTPESLTGEEDTESEEEDDDWNWNPEIRFAEDKEQEDGVEIANEEEFTVDKLYELLEEEGGVMSLERIAAIAGLADTDEALACVKEAREDYDILWEDEGDERITVYTSEAWAYGIEISPDEILSDSFAQGESAIVSGRKKDYQRIIEEIKGFLKRQDGSATYEEVQKEVPRNPYKVKISMKEMANRGILTPREEGVVLVDHLMDDDVQRFTDYSA